MRQLEGGFNQRLHNSKGCKENNKHHLNIYYSLLYSKSTSSSHEQQGSLLQGKLTLQGLLQKAHSNLNTGGALASMGDNEIHCSGTPDPPKVTGAVFPSCVLQAGEAACGLPSLQNAFYKQKNHFQFSVTFRGYKVGPMLRAQS